MDPIPIHAFRVLPFDFEIQETGIIGLPPILPHFAVPHLADKPQDPIIDAIKRDGAARKYTRDRHIPPELIRKPATRIDVPLIRKSNENGSLWLDAAKSNTRDMGHIMSWDALCRGNGIQGRGTPFLAEQQDFTLAAARYHVLPRLQDPSIHVLDVNSSQLFVNLKMTVLGTTSSLYAWDQASERFIQAPAKDGRRRLILVDRKDEQISASITQRFMSIGTLLRRLEILVASIRTRLAGEGPTNHAFAHAISTLLTYLNEELAVGPPSDDIQLTQSLAITSIWLYYEAYEETLVALSHFCGRDEDKLPSEYIALDPSPAWLLSRIYEHLNTHIEKHSSRIIVASFAYILETSSRDYLKLVSHSVGIDGETSPQRSRNAYKTGLSPVSTPKEENIVGDTIDQAEETEPYPNFFPPHLASSLPTAKKSLKILRAAQEDHPIFTNCTTARDVEWVWTEEEIQALWSPEMRMTRKKAERDDRPNGKNLPEQKYEPKLAGFRKFDLEPGAHLVDSAPTGLTASSTNYLRNFLADFPESLPAITPTLTHLTSLIFTPLIEHTARLSSDLLSIFLSHSSTLHFQTHLVLLRSYLLLTSHSFKSRLTAALFSDAGDDDPDGSALSSARGSRARSSSDQGETRPWAVGLAPSLANRDTWPPGGADLSFLLRTVIVDSLELDRDWMDGLPIVGGPTQSSRNTILEETEFRLGFAIRDLPIGPGRDRWLNPLSIEALDFLYLDFKPPNPLGVLITPEVMSKYHRLFAFLLRMMRVENVVSALSRMTRNGSKPLFPTLASSNKLLLFFHFIARCFVTSLNGYVYDTAIRGNFDTFLAKLTPQTRTFSDVFSLAKAHSAILDDILFACLLRSGQRAVGDLLRGALAIILDFGILAGELKCGRMEEFRAAPLLENHFRDFRDKMTTLTKVLKALAEKGSLSSGVADSNFGLGQEATQPPRGTDVLYHLLIRLDFGDWWSRLQT